MTDRELLELAAKAAGISGVLVETYGGQPAIRRSDEFQPWQPLADDGDALRLAVKLRMDVDITDYTNRESGVFAMSSSDTDSGIMYDCSSEEDIYAATRRAIVLAAAKVGRSMK